MPSSDVSLALFAALPTKADKIDDFKGFLQGGCEMAVNGEPETIQWFGLKYEGSDTFAVLDTFRTEAARSASFAGHVNGALNEHAPSFLTSSPPNVEKAVVIANKVDASKGKGVKVGLCAFLTPKSDQVDALREFLAGAIPIVEGEDFTPVFYVLELPGAKFVVVALLNDAADREKHAAGNVVGALKEHASGLLASAPEMVKVDVIAASVRL